MMMPGPAIERFGPLAGHARPTPDQRLHVGVDVVDVPRFARLLALRGPALRDHVFTSGEFSTCRGSPPRLAARLAAKEATAKALGTGIGPIAWLEVEVLIGPAGDPRLSLAGAARVAADDQGLDCWAVSLAHDAARALAFVVAIGRGDG